MAHTSPHHDGDRPRVRCSVLTVSDTRSLDSDESGRTIAAMLGAAGHDVGTRLLVKDNVEGIRRAVLDVVEAGSCDALILTGGTGIGLHDVTPEALAPLFACKIDGFGEMFRQLSYAELGPKAMLSRAQAGTIHRTIVFALPGSVHACKMAIEKLILPILPHGVGLLQPHLLGTQAQAEKK